MEADGAPTVFVNPGRAQEKASAGTQRESALNAHPGGDAGAQVPPAVACSQLPTIPISTSSSWTTPEILRERRRGAANAVRLDAECPKIGRAADATAAAGDWKPRSETDSQSTWNGDTRVTQPSGETVPGACRGPSLLREAITAATWQVIRSPTESA